MLDFGSVHVEIQDPRISELLSRMLGSLEVLFFLSPNRWPSPSVLGGFFAKRRWTNTSWYWIRYKDRLRIGRKGRNNFKNTKSFRHTKKQSWDLFVSSPQFFLKKRWYTNKTWRLRQCPNGCRIPYFPQMVGFSLSNPSTFNLPQDGHRSAPPYPRAVVAAGGLCGLLCRRFCGKLNRTELRHWVLAN